MTDNNPIPDDGLISVDEFHILMERLTASLEALMSFSEEDIASLAILPPSHLKELIDLLGGLAGEIGPALAHIDVLQKQVESAMSGHLGGEESSDEQR